LISLFFSDLYGRMRTHADSRMVAEEGLEPPTHGL
jgi:hypothetical protein